MTNKEIEKLKSSVRNIPDFPKKGIQFKDVTTLFQSAENLKTLSDILVKKYKDKGITKVIGIESRGFIMGPILALNLNAGFVPIRKPGKLPAETYEISYEKEYGTDNIQIHKDAITNNDVVLIHDDLLATGGTMVAAYELVNRMNVKKIYINFIIELENLRGREQFPTNVDVEAIIKYDI